MLLPIVMTRIEKVNLHEIDRKIGTTRQTKLRYKGRKLFIITKLKYDWDYFKKYDKTIGISRFYWNIRDCSKWKIVVFEYDK